MAAAETNTQTAEVETAAAPQAAEAAKETAAPAKASEAKPTTILTADAEAGDKPADGAAKEGGDEASKPPEGAPAKYEFTAGDGREFDPKVLEAFSGVAKELNLSQANAQKLLDKVGPVLEQRQVERIAEARKGWREQFEFDPDMGGPKQQETIASAKRALEVHGTPELKQLLNETGLGDHPEVIRFFAKAGRTVSEDGFVGGARSTAPKSTAEVFFPGMNP